MTFFLLLSKWYNQMDHGDGFNPDNRPFEHSLNFSKRNKGVRLWTKLAHYNELIHWQSERRFYYNLGPQYSALHMKNSHNCCQLHFIPRWYLLWKVKYWIIVWYQASFKTYEALELILWRQPLESILWPPLMTNCNWNYKYLCCHTGWNILSFGVSKIQVHKNCEIFIYLF